MSILAIPAPLARFALSLSPAVAAHPYRLGGVLVEPAPVAVRLVLALALTAWRLAWAFALRPAAFLFAGWGAVAGGGAMGWIDADQVAVLSMVWGCVTLWRMFGAWARFFEGGLKAV